MSETCGNCKHAVAIDPNGWWRHKGLYNWPETHVHCAQVDYMPITAKVMLKGTSCTFSPSRWEDKGYPIPSYDSYVLQP